MILSVNLGAAAYDVVLEAGCLDRAGALLPLQRKALIVTDNGVPPSYVRKAAAACGQAAVVAIPQGEGSKTLSQLERLLREMLSQSFTRKDCVVAVGGGVVGDLAGFAAACYMRGIDFFNIPTTLLAQADASIGGKTAVNLDGVKNIVGAFHQPRKVLIDPDLLQTLPPRQMANGMAEVIKTALCFDAEGFALLEAEYAPSITETLARSLRVKKYIVEQDEREAGLRKTLNFGHTLGHAIESMQGENGLLHGECVALGMLPMCAEEVRKRLLPVLKKWKLPTFCGADPGRVMEAVLHDKKAAEGKIDAVVANAVGHCRIETMTPDAIWARYTACFGEKKP